MDIVKLPRTFSEFKRLTANSMTDPHKVWLAMTGKYDKAFEDVPTDIKQMLKYCGPNYCNGRPSNKVMIVLVGQSGAGKSSTINNLFEDPNLCNTSDSTSETRDVIECHKILTVLEETPAIEASLSFVDLPGALDTNSRLETENAKKIQRFRTEHLDLIFTGNTFPGMKISKKIYPNLVLLVVASTDDRMVGPDSNFQKTLKSLHKYDLIDGKKNNLIAVATKVMTIPKKKFSEKTTNIQKIIQNAVKDVLDITNIPVVFIENCAEDCDLEKDDGEDFYRLPNGELSHYNLIQEMTKLFGKNEDFLAQLLIGWYFRSDCPDKTKSVATIRDFMTNPITQEKDLDLEAEEMIKLNTQESSKLHKQLNSQIPSFMFQFLGFGYCPKGETTKCENALRPSVADNMQEISVAASKFKVSQNFKFFSRNETRFERLSFESQENYQQCLAKKLALDAGIKLVVNISSEGRWIKDETSSSSVSTLSFLYETRVGFFKASQESIELSRNLKNALDGLPTCYTTETAAKFNLFFSKWGTHFVSEIPVGGSIKLEVSVKKSIASEQLVRSLQMQVNGMFSSLFSLEAGNDLSEFSKYLISIGVQNESLHITGGDPPGVISIQGLDPDIFKKWVESVKLNPTELEHSVKLYPYYNIVAPEAQEILKEATTEYLSGQMTRKLKIRRNDYSQKIVVDAINYSTKESRRWCALI